MSRRAEAVASGPAAIAAGGNIGSASSTNIGTQVLGVSAVPVDAAVKDPGSVFTAVGVEAFTGREWLAREVDRSIAASPCGYVFVEAEAGLGKTAFAAWLVKMRGCVSHFSRYAGGRSVRGALQNLSAQLVTRYELGDQAPGGMLPDWAQTPGGFESLLALAAARTRQDRHRLVLVVDGLDEAEPAEHGLPFGLPALLPDGVHVVATHRTGFSLDRPDSDSVTLRISKSDRRNTSDIAAFLSKAVKESVLADRLAEAGVDPARFAAILGERCDGVWVFLRYVLQEVRLGLRPPGTVGDVPSGLLGYYADQIRRWRKDAAWDGGLLPLLATLGVAGEPLPISALARLAGDLSPAAVRRWCDCTFRPLLTTSSTTELGASLRYEIYHTSFREVLKALHGQQLPAAEGPYGLEALADELHQATHNAHDRIASKYLIDFGTMQADLAALAQDPAAAAHIDDGYALRHLARHLDHSGRVPELHQLLAVAHGERGGREVNVWFAAHDHADCLSSYLTDLARAQHASTAASRDALRRRQQAPSLGVEVRCALMAASITSQAVRISHELLNLLILNGLWSPARVLDHARRLIDPASRYQALLTACRYLDKAERPAILRETLAAASAIDFEYARAEALTELAPHLPTDLLRRALQTATAINDEIARAEALTGLAPQLPGEQRADVLCQALTAAIAISHQFARAKALSKLAPHLSADLLEEALAAAAAISQVHGRARALTGLAPHLSADLAAQALAAAAAIDFEHARAEALTGLAPHIPADLLSQTLTAVTALSDGSYRATALTALAPHLSADLVGQATATANAISDEYSRATALTALAPQLPADQKAEVLGQALAATARIRWEYQRGRVLTMLASQLPADQRADVLKQALADLTSSSWPNDLHVRALVELVPHLPDDLLSEALTAATVIKPEDSRANALVRLAPHLPPDLLGDALAAAAQIGSGNLRAWALVGLAPHLPADQRAVVLGQALAAGTAIGGEYARARTLTALATRLPADQRADALEQALAVATAISNPDARAEVLTEIAPHLPDDLLHQALADATNIGRGDARARALMRLALHLPPDRRADALEQALAVAIATATATADPRDRSGVLAELAPHLPADLLGEALAAVTAIGDEYPRARVLAGLAPHLPADLLGKALAAATAIDDEYARSEALTGLAPHLPADLLGKALAAATAIDDEYARARTLSALALRLPADQQTDVLAQALAAATRISLDQRRAQALTVLAPRLPVDQRADVLAKALEVATSITLERDRAEALTRLAPQLPADLLGQALETASAITEDFVRPAALAGLAPYLPADLMNQARASAAAIDSKEDQVAALTALVPHLPAEQRADVLAHTLKTATTISSENGRVEALVSLAAQLPPELLDDAFVSTPKGDVEAIAAILKRGVSVLPPADYKSLLRLFRASLDDADRNACLIFVAVMAPCIAEVGGTLAVQECVKAIEDVHRWWP